MVAHLDAHEILGEKARWELHKNPACNFEQILEATPHKKAVVQPLISHLTNHQDKANRICWRSRDELLSEVLL